MGEKKSNSLISQMRKIVRAERGSFANTYQLGVELLNAGEFEKAAAALSEAIKENPDFYLSHHYLGEAFYNLENWVEAEKSFNESSQRNLYFAATQAFLGDLAFIKQDITQAEDFYQKAASLNPKLHKSQVGLLKVFYKSYKESSESAADDTKEKFVQLCKFTSDDFDLLVEILDIHSPDLEFYRKLGDYFKTENQLEKSINCFHLALSLEPDNVVTLLKIADVYFDAGENVLAAEYLSKTAGHKNNSAEVYSIMGEIWSKQNRYAEAIAAYCQALELDQNNAELHKIIGDLQSKQGLINDASLSYSRATELGYEIY